MSTISTPSTISATKPSPWNRSSLDIAGVREEAMVLVNLEKKHNTQKKNLLAPNPHQGSLIFLNLLCIFPKPSRRLPLPEKQGTTLISGCEERLHQVWLGFLSEHPENLCNLQKTSQGGLVACCGHETPGEEVRLHLFFCNSGKGECLSPLVFLAQDPWQWLDKVFWTSSA